MEGKVNGTQMIYNSLCDFLGAEKDFSFEKELPQNSFIHIEMTDKLETSLEKLISSIYPVQDDDERMRKMQTMKEEERITYFDSQRKNYPIRREFNNYTIQSDNSSTQIREVLTNLRFKLSKFT